MVTGSSRLSLKPAVKPSHRLPLSPLPSCSHVGEKYFHFVFSFNKNEFSALETWQAVGSTQGYTVYLDIYIEIKIFLSFFLSCAV